MFHDLTPAQRQLADYMSDLSEDAYCAGWMRDLEYDLWECVTTSREKYGTMRITVVEKRRLQELSDACQGWIIYDGESEETFVPIREWVAKYADRSP